ncbi:12-oxophytodienoate reductase [Fusarium coicis]|nr:12-oxophytodienoate reductase [Fusarium coicis]
MGDIIDAGASSKLFTPLDIGNGKVHLKHRIIYAPLTRNRGTPVNLDSTPEKPSRLWIPNDLMLWHSGRANIPHLTGTPILAPSATPWDDPNETFAYHPSHSTAPVKIADHPPIEMTVDKIKSTISDYFDAAKDAIEAGFDGVEVHGGNGYLVEQFLSSNINKRTDHYGGTVEKRCNFALELMEELAKAIGQENLAIRLTPFGLLNQARGEKHVETWSLAALSHLTPRSIL